MAAQLNLTTVKLGNNADTSKNFLIQVPSVADGTLTISRENGSQTVLSIDTAGRPSFPQLANYANDAAAASGGVPVGSMYRNGSILMQRVA